MLALGPERCRISGPVETSDQRLLYELTRGHALSGAIMAEGFTPSELAMARARVQADLTAERQAGQKPSRTST